MARISRTVHAIYRRTELRQSGRLENGGSYHIAYQDLSPEAMTAVSNICIAKGHRLISGFFGLGLLVSGFLDFLLGMGTGEELTVTKAFGLVTAIVLLLASYSRNYVIAQQMKIIDSIICSGEGMTALARDDSLNEALSGFDSGKYDVIIGSPVIGISGIDLIKKET